MTKEPKVSVCVITYNHGEWLRECLQSIVDQETDFEYEVIVGDDCSTDGVTREILREFADRYPSKIVPLLRKVNMGGGGTQNWLDVMRRARGEYIAHIDGDDRMLPGKLQKQSDFLDAQTQCAIVAHDLRTFDASSGAILASTFAHHHIPEISDINYLLVRRCYFGHSSKMFRRNAMITKERDEPTVDFYMHIEHASRGKIGYICEVLGEYRKSSDSATNAASGAFKSVLKGYNDAFARALELGADPSIVETGRLRFRYSIAREFLRISDAENFARNIKLTGFEWRYATWRHRLLSAIACFPFVASGITRSYRRIWNPLRKLFRLILGR